ncbi:MAG: hypothetical protein ACRED2_05320, partial [Methylocella sp.]
MALCFGIAFAGVPESMRWDGLIFDDLITKGGGLAHGCCASYYGQETPPIQMRRRLFGVSGLDG